MCFQRLAARLTRWAQRTIRTRHRTRRECSCIELPPQGPTGYGPRPRPSARPVNTEVGNLVIRGHGLYDCTDLGHTLILYIYQRRRPCPSSQNDPVSIILSAIDSLNANTCRSVGGEERLLESTGPMMV
jgi:hypothetical protein